MVMLLSAPGRPLSFESGARQRKNCAHWPWTACLSRALTLAVSDLRAGTQASFFHSNSRVFWAYILGF